MPSTRDANWDCGRIAATRRTRRMRLALLGGGTIARLVLENLRRGALPGMEVVALAGRAAASRASALAGEYGIDYVRGAPALCAAKPDVVLEAASHDAVRTHLVPVLAAGSSVIVLSAGALVDDALRAQAGVGQPRGRPPPAGPLVLVGLSPFSRRSGRAAGPPGGSVSRGTGPAVASGHCQRDDSVRSAPRRWCLGA